MKRIFIVAFFAILLAIGCQKTEILNPNDSYHGLMFAAEFGKMTKAEAGANEDGMHNLKAQDFRIWAYAASDFPNTPEDDANKIFDNIQNIKVYDYQVTDSEGKSVDAWKTDVQYFWPGKDKSLYFFAVSDTTSFLGNSGTQTDKVEVKFVADTDTPTVPALIIKDYEVATTNPNNDLMVANFVKQHQDQSNKKVSLKFNHTLSKVQFNFKTNEVSSNGDNITVFVQKLEVGELADDNTTVENGLKNKGQLTVTVKETTAGTEPTETVQGTAEVSTLNMAWDLENTQVIYTEDYDTVPDNFPTSIDGTPVGNNTDRTAMVLTPTPKPFATWLVLPQDVKGKKVKVTYLINERQFTNEFKLDAFTDSDEDPNTCMWAVNQYIKYNINLSPNLITFTADVKPWNPETGSDVTHRN